MHFQIEPYLRDIAHHISNWSVSASAARPWIFQSWDSTPGLFADAGRAEVHAQRELSSVSEKWLHDDLQVLLVEGKLSQEEIGGDLCVKRST